MKKVYKKPTITMETLAVEDVLVSSVEITVREIVDRTRVVVDDFFVFNENDSTW